MYTIRMLVRQPMRLLLTVGGIALCIMLMLFLLGIYRGVADGSVDYIRACDADLWILQKGATNILRGTSMLPRAAEEKIRRVVPAERVAPVLLLLSTVGREGRSSTIFLAGYRPADSIGGPPWLFSGRNIRGRGEIVLDRALAAKIGARCGDAVIVREDTLILVGISGGTNAFVIQYGFTMLDRSGGLAGFFEPATFFAVKLIPSADREAARRALRAALSGVEVYTREEFLANNIRETESGILPIFYAVAAIGGIVLTIILSLILSISILERKKDFAVMKAIGAPHRFLPLLVLRQALALSFAAIVAACILFFPMTFLIEQISPEVETRTTIPQIAATAAGVCAMSLVSALLAIRRLRRIYPLEVFK